MSAAVASGVAFHLFRTSNCHRYPHYDSLHLRIVRPDCLCRWGIVTVLELLLMWATDQDWIHVKNLDLLVHANFKVRYLAYNTSVRGSKHYHVLTIFIHT